LNIVAKQHIPCVGVYADKNNGSMSTINIDDSAGAKLAVNYLLQHGHRRIAMLNGTMDTLVAKNRTLGYEKALVAAQVTPDPTLISGGGFFLESGYEQTVALLDRTRDFTAIFCASDDLAYGCLKALKENKIRVPEDVSVMGFDDKRGSADCDPPLTTLAQPLEEIGKLATELLIKRVHQPKAPLEHLILPLQLVERQSVKQLHTTNSANGPKL
jgi:LacI family transcriptional regulator, repressor for deo operon, udp, cdd, tsx, nupC, and nupG